MKYQERDYWCGLASMAVASRLHGYPCSQNKLAKIVEPTPEEGVDEVGIKRGLLAIGFIPEVLNSSLSRVARNWLAVKLRLGYPVILCSGKLKWQHWVCAVGMLGNRFLVFDPARFEYRVNTGIQMYTWERLSKWWYANKEVRGSDGAYYGIAVLKDA